MMLDLKRKYRTRNDVWDVELLTELKSGTHVPANLFPFVGLMTHRATGAQRTANFNPQGHWPTFNALGTHEWDLIPIPSEQWFAIYPERVYDTSQAAFAIRNRSLTYIQTIEIDLIGEWYHPGFPEAQTEDGRKARFLAGTRNKHLPRVFALGEDDDPIIRTDDQGRRFGVQNPAGADVRSRVQGFFALQSEEGFNTEAEAREAAGSKAIAFVKFEA